MPADDNSIRDATMDLKPFKICADEDALVDLQSRLSRTRWPRQVDDGSWEAGADRSYMESLCTYWMNEYDWRAAEAALNRWPQFETNIDGARIHFLHIRSPHPDARPLLMVHGWPSTPFEFAKLFGGLTDPAGHGNPSGQPYHIVAPSIPGYGWSGPVTEPGWHPGRIAHAFRELMSRLGYERFAAFGADMGSPISIELAHAYPEALIGLYLTLIPSGLQPADGSPTPDEQRQLNANELLRRTEGGYAAIQATKPDTVAYGLTDSPVGLAAWLVEKFRSWTDCNGDLESILSKDEILTTVMTYWLTATAGSSGRLYYELAKYFGNEETRIDRTRVLVPTGVGVFPKELYLTSERIAEDHFQIEHWSQMPRGGHFAAVEQPELLLADVRKFFDHRQ
ncbi:epoxide hydrolase family protein [Mycobacterium sp. 48b]|uniref:epoxide hydrolase family protein n=1 Tax=Mycobacterium sp. 48b TaxID=3400426 RepID=UPI003AACF8C5